MVLAKAGVNLLLALGIREPGDLVIERALIGPVRIGEERAGNLVEHIGHGQAGGGEGLPELIALTIDVEVAQDEQVLRPVAGLVGPVAHPARDRLEFGNAAAAVGAVHDMQRHENEGGGAGAEADGVGRARELALQRISPDLLEPLLGHHQLAGQAGGLEPRGVVEEGHALVVARGALSHVRHQEGPVVAEPAHQVAQRAQVALDLLEGDDIEAPQDLADGQQRTQVTLR